MKKSLCLLLMATGLVASFAVLSACKEQTPVHEHAYQSAVTDPTCLEQGFTTHTCACGESFVDAYLPALGHDFVRYFSDGNADYERDGTKTAECERTGCAEKDTVTDIGSALRSKLVFKTLPISSLQAKIVVSNATSSFDFSKEIELIGNASYFLSADSLGENPMDGSTVLLAEGDNPVYLHAVVAGKRTTYSVVLRRRPLYSVFFEGIEEPQTVEEGGLIPSPPAPEKQGYDFAGWEYDFSAPVTGETKINAKWTARTDTPYTVEHYLETLTKGEYELCKEATERKTGETGKEVQAAPKQFSHFTFLPTDDRFGTVRADGGLVVKVYYERNEYLVTTTANLDGGGLYTEIKEKYRYGESVSVTASVFLGYQFLGWYKGETQISEAAQASLTVDGESIFTARYAPRAEMVDF